MFLLSFTWLLLSQLNNESPISQDLKVKCRSGDYLLQKNFTLVCQQPKTLSLLQRVVDNQASPEMFLLSLPQLLFSNLALFLIANCLRRGSASNLGQNLGENLKSRISPLRIWYKATLLNADGGVTCSPVLYHHCLLEPEGKSLLMSFQIDSNLYEDC